LHFKSIEDVTLAKEFSVRHQDEAKPTGRECQLKPRLGAKAAFSLFGVYRPSRLVPNSEIVDLIDSSDEWIVQRTGIEFPSLC